MESNPLVFSILIVGLCLSVITDISRHRIPNWLTLCLCLSALILHIWFGGLTGILFVTSGILVGLCCFLPLYLFGAMGAGDVKLLASVGAFVGPSSVVWAALMTILAGGVIAIFFITLKGGLMPMIRRYYSMALSFTLGQFQYIPPIKGEAAGLRFPYALAIASGTALSLWYF